MHVANVKVSVKPSIIFYVLLVTGILALSTKMVSDILMNMNFENHTMNTAPIVLRKEESISPSVVELFTSEGCSSCPPADKLVAVAQKEFNENTIVLSYHVDYWDRLGWKDPFSKSAFSDRQREYARHLNLESVYTPQIIVNGKTEFVGSNKSALWSAIRGYNNIASGFIETETEEFINKQLLVKYSYAPLKANETVVLLLVLKNASTQVKGGENSGAELNHLNIVQDIVQKKESAGTAIFKLPVNFIKEKYLVVAFIQNTQSLEIINAKKINVS